MRTHARACTHMHTCAYICIHTYMHACTCAHTHACTHTRTCTCVHTRTWKHREETWRQNKAEMRTRGGSYKQGKAIEKKGVNWTVGRGRGVGREDTEKAR